MRGHRCKYPFNYQKQLNFSKKVMIDRWPSSQGSTYWIANMLFSEIRRPIEVEFHMEHALDETTLI